MAKFIIQVFALTTSRIRRGLLIALRGSAAYVVPVAYSPPGNLFVTTRPPSFDYCNIVVGNLQRTPTLAQFVSYGIISARALLLFVDSCFCKFAEFIDYPHSRVAIDSRIIVATLNPVWRCSL